MAQKFTFDVALLTEGAWEPKVQEKRGGIEPIGTPSLGRLKSYLAAMRGLSEVVQDHSQEGALPLTGVKVLLSHPLTIEILGFITALWQLGCRDIESVFTGYSSVVEEACLSDLMAFPSEVLSYVVLSECNTSCGNSKFLLTCRPESRELASASQVGNPLIGMLHDSTFQVAMGRLSMYSFLRQLARARRAGAKCLVIEEGGYLAPLINEVARVSIAELRNKFHLLPDPATDKVLPASFGAATNGVLLGTVEHARCGYNRLMSQQRSRNGLYFPTITTSLSFLNTRMEGDTMAAMILNTIDTIFCSQGELMNRCQTVVLGCRGNVGRWLMKYLSCRKKSELELLMGCDLKVGQQKSSIPLPNWQLNPSSPAVFGCQEVDCFKAFSRDDRRATQLIIGVSGGPSDDKSSFDVADLHEWLLYGVPETLFITNGTSKVGEFPELLPWFEEVLADDGSCLIDDIAATISQDPIESRLNKRHYGSRYQFRMQGFEGQERIRDVYLINDLMPISHLHHASTTESSEEALAQLMSASLIHTRNRQLSPRLYAVDYDEVVSTNVYGARIWDKPLRLPLH